MKTLIIVHGMGNHTEESVTKSVIETLNEVFKTYDSLSGSATSDKFDLKIVEYNSFFEDYRKGVKGRTDLLEAMQEVQRDWPVIPSAAAAISGIESSIIEDSSFNTHWLDVILYRYTMMSEPIRLKLGEVIAQLVTDRGSSGVHVMGHSLGTAIVHDTLAKLYGPDQFDDKLSNSADKLGGVHMVANVSRILQSFTKVGASEVRPMSGCCKLYYEYRHTLDPFTKIKPFDPTDNEEWISHAIWKRAYQIVRPSSVTNSNTHSLSHYLKNPEVHLPLFRSVFNFQPRVADKEKAQKIYNDQTVKHKAFAVQEAFEGFEYSVESLQNLLNAGKTLKEMVEQLGDEF